MRLYGVNYTDSEGNTQSVFFLAPNKNELSHVIKDNYGIVRINWIEHIQKKHPLVKTY